jgi:hypothetical protein
MSRLSLAPVCLCLCLLASFFVLPPLVEAQSFNPEIYYQIRARHSNRCLDVPFASFNNGVQLQQYDCNGAPQQNQLWTIVPTVPASGTFRIVSANNAKCVDALNAGTMNLTAIQQYTCNVGGNQANQVFYITAAPTAGYYRVYGAHTAGAPKCLDVAGNSTANGALVQQYDCGPSWNANQDWQFVAFTPRVPLTHLGVNGYYGESVNMATGIPISGKDHVNQAEAGAGNIGAVAATGVKARFVIQGDFFRWGPKRRDPNNPNACSGGDYIYSDTTAQGGLRRDYLTQWNAIKTQINAAGGTGAIGSFYLIDEPYATMTAPNNTNFCANEIYEMLSVAAHAIKLDYPSIPIFIADGYYEMHQSWPADVDWVGHTCYEPAGCGGESYQTIHNRLKSHLLSHQRVMILPHSSVDRQWFHCDPNQAGCVMVPYRPYRGPNPYEAQPAELVTTQAERDKLVADAEFFLDFALRDPVVVGLANWHYSTRLFDHAPANVDLGIVIGTSSITDAGGTRTVLDKWRFQMRALGFGTP